MAEELKRKKAQYLGDQKQDHEEIEVTFDKEPEIEYVPQVETPKKNDSQKEG